MPVFISYRHTDRAHAMAINSRLIQANIKTYLDVLDPESQTTDDITGGHHPQHHRMHAFDGGGLGARPRNRGGCRSKSAKRPSAIAGSALQDRPQRTAAVPR